MSYGTKRSQYLYENNLPNYLRELADAIEKGETEEYGCLSEFSKLTITVKKEFGRVRIKTKFKNAAECTAQELETEQGSAPGKPSYGALKKRMKWSFKALLSAVRQGELPSGEIVDSFLADSGLMVTYPGYGDEFYDEYSQACDNFRASHESGDTEAMMETLIALAKLKSRCHAKYD